MMKAQDNFPRTGMAAKIKRWAVIAPLVVGLSLAGIYGVQRQIDRHHRLHFDEQLLFLPNARLLNYFTAGLNTVIADILWVKTILYMSQEFHSQSRKFTWLDHMCTTVTRLDPYFTGAYVNGATLCAAIGNDEVADRILRNGIRHRPDRWELPFEMAKLYILNRRDRPEAPAYSSFFLIWAAQLSEGKQAEDLSRWAEAIQLQHNLKEEGRRIWENVLRTSGSSLMRQIAERKLREMDLHDLLEILQKKVDAYTRQEGHAPASLDDLVTAGLLPRVPVDPLGGKLFIDNKGRVNSTALVAETVRLARRRIENAILKFKDKNDRYPASLDELVSSGVLSKKIPNPYPGATWIYDPQTGAVRSSVPIDEDSEGNTAQEGS